MDPNADRRVARAAAAVYLPLTLAAAALFAFAAALQGRTGPATVAAGAFWVGLLVLIVLMPLVTPAVRRRLSAGPLAAVAVAALLGLSACGGQGRQAAGTSSSVPTGEVQLVTVKASEFKFSDTTLRVRAGQPVRLVLDNAGQVEHDLRVPKLPAREVKALTESHGHAGEVAAHAAPGKQAWVEFTPTTKGTYDVECTITGHKEAGMKGKLLVE